jgi:hypothetical protein
MWSRCLTACNTVIIINNNLFFISVLYTRMFLRVNWKTSLTSYIVGKIRQMKSKEYCTEIQDEYFHILYYKTDAREEILYKLWR